MVRGSQMGLSKVKPREVELRAVVMTVSVEDLVVEVGQDLLLLAGVGVMVYKLT